MIAILVRVQVKPEARDAFLSVIAEDARDSVRLEPGCMRFDVLQDVEDANKFVFYEVYRDAAAVEAHRQMPHYAKWREHGVPLLVAPATITRTSTVFPADAAWHKP